MLRHNTPEDAILQTWVSFVNVKSKEQSKQWMNTHSTDKPMKFELGVV
jgi:hypothetical protein